jgi:crotonobetainyl-CoA:carnitine CoA-transferase CaiB-like acyl-CoA transferase
MQPGALEKLGIGKNDLPRENPGLIIGTVSGYGQSGPYAGNTRHLIGVIASRPPDSRRFPEFRP